MSDTRTDWCEALQVFAPVTAFSGLWLARYGTTVLIQSSHSLDAWITALIGWSLLFFGITGWSLSSPAKSIFRTRAQSTTGVLVTAALFSALLFGWLLVPALAFADSFLIHFRLWYRLCPPGNGNGPPGVAWLFPLAVYFGIGYYGFFRARRRWLFWLLAAVAGSLALLAVMYLGTTSGGCGD